MLRRCSDFTGSYPPYWCVKTIQRYYRCALMHCASLRGNAAAQAAVIANNENTAQPPASANGYRRPLISPVPGTSHHAQFPFATHRHPAMARHWRRGRYRRRHPSGAIRQCFKRWRLQPITGGTINPTVASTLHFNAVVSCEQQPLGPLRRCGRPDRLSSLAKLVQPGSGCCYLTQRLRQLTPPLPRVPQLVAESYHW